MQNAPYLAEILSVRGIDHIEHIAAAHSQRSENDPEVIKNVTSILAEVRNQGDKGLLACIAKFDKVQLNEHQVCCELDSLTAAAPSAAVRRAINLAIKNVKAYHLPQKRKGYTLKTPTGVLQQILKPLGRVAVYIPGGYTVYPSSVIMCVIPALVAGVKDIVAVTPPREQIDPALLYTLKRLGIKQVLQMGGAHAIAALAYGTESIKRVDKIVGPGNAYVAAAKRAVYGDVDIDSIAGPSEVAILADASADPAAIAVDLLAQAEHGSGYEMACMICESKAFAQKVQKQLQKLYEQSPTQEVFNRLRSGAITLYVTKSRKQSLLLINSLAAEHLQLMTADYKNDLKQIQNGAAIFCGPYTSVPFGDYIVGTNHVLPTGTGARFASGLGVEDFYKRLSVATLTKKGASQLSGSVSAFARAENFIYHAMSAEYRE